MNKHSCKEGTGFLFLLAAMTVLHYSVGAKAQATRPVEDDVKARVFARLLGLRNVDAQYDYVENYTPSAEVKARLLLLGEHPLEGTNESQRRFSFLNGCARFESCTSQESLEKSRKDGAEEVSQNIYIEEPHRIEMFSKYEGDAPSGLITGLAAAKNAGDCYLAIAIGLCGTEPQSDWLDQDALDQSEVVYDPKSNDTVIVRRKLGLDPKLLQSWWCKVDGPTVRITKYTYASNSGEVYRQIDCDDFHEYEGFSLPSKIKMIEYSINQDRSRYVGETVQIKVDQYTVNGKENTLEKYKMVWPIGSRVTDDRNHANFTIKTAARTLDDDFIISRITKRNLVPRVAPATQPGQ